MSTPFREITAGLRFPEGPIAMPDGCVLLVEIERRTLTRVAPDGTKTIVARFTGGPNGAAIGPDGKCYVCNNGGFRFVEDASGLRPVIQSDDYSGGRIERVDLATGAIETLYTHGGVANLRGPNDIVFDGGGGFYFTDLGKSRARERDHGGVYYAKADGSLIREIVHPILTPNGIGLSPDDRTLYVAETEGARLWAFDLVAPGEIRKAPFPSPHGGRLIGQGREGYQRFDSLALDADGNVCVATLMNGGVTIVPPDGKPSRFLPFPDVYVTNICFGGKDMRTAYLTLSAFGKLIAVDWERPGLKLHHINK